MIIHNVQQGSVAWEWIRAQRLTASNAQAIATGGAGLKTLCYQKVANMITGVLPDQIRNKDIDRGHAIEPKARAAYELIKQCKVQVVGFVEIDDFVGFSPDGFPLLEDPEGEGLIEIKCKSNEHHLRLLLEEKIDPAHICQMQMEMLLSGRKWCDYFGYNQFYGEMQFLRRIYPDPAIQAKLADGLALGREIMRKMYEQLKGVKKWKLLQNQAI